MINVNMHERDSDFCTSLAIGSTVFVEVHLIQFPAPNGLVLLLIIWPRLRFTSL